MRSSTPRFQIRGGAAIRRSCEAAVLCADFAPAWTGSSFSDVRLTAIYDFVKPAADTDYWWSVPGPNILGEFLDNGEPPDSEDFV